MKVLVVGGCATRSYVEFFQKCFPEWETRSALLVQVDEWVEEGNEPFHDYVKTADIFVGLTNREPLNSLIPDGRLNVFVPSFDFFGYLPDSVFLIGVPAALEMGIIHSRIAVSSYLSGLDEADALTLYNRDHFDKLGYFEAFNRHKESLFDKFDEYDIDLRERFDCWSKDGNFLYTVNHPHTTVFFDIVCVAMKKYFPELLTDKLVAEARETVDDYMGDGLVWGMFPEISEHIGIPQQPSNWRTSVIHGKKAKYLDLEELVKRSYEIYRDHGEISADVIRHLGGKEEIARHAGCSSMKADFHQKVA